VLSLNTLAYSAQTSRRVRLIVNIRANDKNVHIHNAKTPLLSIVVDLLIRNKSTTNPQKMEFELE